MRRQFILPGFYPSRSNLSRQQLGLDGLARWRCVGMDRPSLIYKLSSRIVADCGSLAARAVAKAPGRLTPQPEKNEP